MKGLCRDSKGIWTDPIGLYRDVHEGATGMIYVHYPAVRLASPNEFGTCKVFPGRPLTWLKGDARGFLLSVLVCCLGFSGVFFCLGDGVSFLVLGRGPRLRPNSKKNHATAQAAKNMKGLAPFLLISTAECVIFSKSAHGYFT